MKNQKKFLKTLKKHKNYLKSKNQTRLNLSVLCKYYGYSYSYFILQF